MMKNPLQFRYSRHTGYDVSENGDTRYAKTAMLSNGKTIEESFNEAIANLPEMDPEKYYPYLLSVYKQWASENPLLIQELRLKAQLNSYCLRDPLSRCAIVSVARALVQILNE